MKYLMLLLLVFGLGTTHAQTVNPCRADIDTSGIVDFSDFLLFALACCAIALKMKAGLSTRKTLMVNFTCARVTIFMQRWQPRCGPCG